MAAQFYIPLSRTDSVTPSGERQEAGPPPKGKQVCPGLGGSPTVEAGECEPSWGVRVPVASASANTCCLPSRALKPASTAGPLLHEALSLRGQPGTQTRQPHGNPAAPLLGITPPQEAAPPLFQTFP